jgi:hypothetical protein
MPASFLTPGYSYIFFRFIINNYPGPLYTKLSAISYNYTVYYSSPFYRPPISLLSQSLAFSNTA